jgi:hypothetical protein
VLGESPRRESVHDDGHRTARHLEQGNHGSSGDIGGGLYTAERDANSVDTASRGDSGSEQRRLPWLPAIAVAEAETAGADAAAGGRRRLPPATRASFTS